MENPVAPAIVVTALGADNESLIQGVIGADSTNLNDYIKTIVIEAGPTRISANAFMDSSSLTSIKLPAMLLSIGQYAFKNANAALKAEIPSGVELEAAAFEGVSNGTFTFAGASNAIGESATPATATIYCPYGSDASAYAAANGMQNLFFTDVFTATIAGDTTEGGVQAFYEKGSAIRPAVTVTLKDGTALSGDDFTVSYPDAVAVGDYALTVQGGKRFPAEANTQTIPFKVIAAPTEELTVELSAVSFAYTGKAIEPAVTVKLNGTVVTEGFTVSYENNVEPGTARAIVTGDGIKIAGAVAAEFTILERIIEIPVYSKSKLNKVTILVGQKCVFKIPEGETGKLDFNSVDKPKVLRVTDQDGVTTGEALKPGKAKLSFKVGRKTRTVNITVIDLKEVKKITIIDKATGKKPKDDKRTLYHNEGKTIDLKQFLVFTPAVEGSTEVCTDVTWLSKKPKVVSVDEYGVVRAVGKPGTATIVVQSAYPGNTRVVKQTIIIKVK